MGLGHPIQYPRYLNHSKALSVYVIGGAFFVWLASSLTFWIFPIWFLEVQECWARDQVKRTSDYSNTVGHLSLSLTSFPHVKMLKNVSYMASFLLPKEVSHVRS